MYKQIIIITGQRHVHLGALDQDQIIEHNLEIFSYKLKTYLITIQEMFLPRLFCESKTLNTFKVTVITTSIPSFIAEVLTTTNIIKTSQVENKF